MGMTVVCINLPIIPINCAVCLVCASMPNAFVPPYVPIVCGQDAEEGNKLVLLRQEAGAEAMRTWKTGLHNQRYKCV